MQRYLRPDLLEAAGIEVFDTWAATFGEVVTQVELAPEGGSSFRMKSRFARFRNVPEMLRMLHVCADIKTAEDLDLPVPADRHQGRRAARPADGDRRTLRRTPQLRRRPGQARRAGTQPGGRPGRRQHAQNLRRRPPGRPGPAPGRAPATDTRAKPRRPPAGSRPSGRHYRDRVLPGPRRHGPTRPAARCNWCSATSAPPATGGTSTTNSATQLAARGVPRGRGPVHPRGQDRPGQGPAVRRLPQRPRRRPGRLDREDGRRHQRARPGHRPAPPRRPLAARRRRPARRPHRPAGQPQPRGADLPVGDRRAASTATCGRPSNARPGSSARSSAAASTPARSATSATPPCPTARSRPWPPATRC